MLHHEPKSSSFTFCSKAWWYKEKLEKIKCKRRVQKRQEAVLEFFRETEPRGYTHTHTHTHTHVYIYGEREEEREGERDWLIYCRNWLTRLWRPRSPTSSHPALCKLENQESWWCYWVQVWRPENRGCVSPNLNLKAWEPGEPLPEHRSCDLSSGRERIRPSLPSCSIWTLNRLADAHKPWGGLSAGLNSPVPMLISSGNTLTDTTSYLGLP